MEALKPWVLWRGDAGDVALEHGSGRLGVHTERGVVWLSPDALVAIVQRFGAPPEQRIAEPTDALALAAGWLGRLRFRPRFDVIARDYVVLALGEEQLVAPAATVAAALRHLARAAAGD